MATCTELAKSMTACKRELLQLEKSGQGHSLNHQDVLDELAAFELEYRQQGCEAPPPPRLGRITTTVLDPPPDIATGEQGDLLIEIQATNDGNVDTSVDYTIDPPLADLTQAGSWTVAIPQGVSHQQATLSIGVSDDAALGARSVPIHESVIFGPVKDGAHQQYDYVSPDPTITIGANPAYAAIEAKAVALGGTFTGPSVEPTQRLIWGPASDGTAYRRRYEKCTIYYSADTGANEIHGEIRNKFDRLPRPTENGTPMVLGIPVTDERGCPDGQGRYNQFSNEGSIYWHPQTGPFAVYGAIRDAWAQAGWETGPLGYPTRDQYIPDPNETDYNIFCVFQNGVLWLDGATAESAAWVGQSTDDIRTQIWQTFNSMLPNLVVRVDLSPSPVVVVGRPGLNPETSTDNVSGNSYGFWQAYNRVATITLHGFVSLNWELPDPEFDAQFSLRLYEDNQDHPFDPSRPPNSKVGQGDHFVYAALTELTVHATGLDNEKVASAVSDAITGALRVPMQIKSTGYQPPDLFSLIVAQDGGVNLYFRPLLKL